MPSPTALTVLLFIVLSGCLGVIPSVVVALRGSPTRVYSSREDGGHAHEDHDILKELHHYELHDFSNLLNHARRRLAGSNDEQMLDLNIFGRSLRVALKKDEELFQPGYTHSFLDETGKEINSEGPLDCIYKAKLVSDDASLNSGSFAMCDDHHIRATVFSDSSFTIEPIMVQRNGRDLEELVHAVYLHGDLKKNPADMAEMAFRPEHVQERPTSLTGVNGGLGNVAGLPFTDSKTKYVGLLQVNDNAFYKKHGSNVHVKAAQLIATTKSYYDLLPDSAPYKIQLNLAKMATFVIRDPYTATYLADGRLNDEALLITFGDWLTGTNYEVDAAHLYVGTKFSRAAGWGYVGTVCEPSNNYNVGETDGTMSDGSASIVAAHEIGHVLGAQHDDVIVPAFGTTCNSAPGIMGRRRLATQFSTCTIEWFRIQFAPGSPYYNTAWVPACLEQPDYVIPTGPICGDGLVEGNEQCDCVGNDCSSDSCCNGATCQFKSGATCAAHQGCCDLTTCQARSSGFVCRASTGQCDVTETCTGNSPDCPADLRVAIGTSCTRTIAGASITGTCTCDGCMSHQEKCRISNAMYVAPCSFMNSGNAMCNVIWCQNAAGDCSGYNEPTPTGLACAAGKACMGNACVASNTVVCPGVLTPNDPTSAPTTRRPTLQPTSNAPASNQPTSVPPTLQPTSVPPTLQPTSVSPTLQPTSVPPTLQPTSAPTLQPTSVPTLQPTQTPTLQTTTQTPTLQTTTQTPTRQPATQTPTIQTTTQTPTIQTTRVPTSVPPTLQPTSVPPTLQPTTKTPTRQPTTTIQPTSKASVCGDGVVEGDEQCDCPGDDCVDDPCCDWASCTFKPGATCAAGNTCCDLTTCQMRSSGFVCRASTGQCDVTETCTGNSPDCPADLRVAIGTSCTRTIAGASITGTCTCEGCMSHLEMCRIAVPGSTSVCTTWNTGEAMCNGLYCQHPVGYCQGIFGLPIGLACAAGKGCMGNACVASNTVVCPGVLTPNDPTSAPTTRRPTLQPTSKAPASNQPTSVPPTLQPTSAPTLKTTTQTPTRQPTTTRHPTTPTLQPTNKASVCGDGIVEGSEQCDCFEKDCSDNPCCDPTTCRLKLGATCAAHQGCCDLTTCKARSSGFTCRASTGQCDVAETCRGDSPDCPADLRVAIGSFCTRTIAGAYISGTCTCDGCMSHQEQCRILQPTSPGLCPFKSSGDEMCDIVFCISLIASCYSNNAKTPTGLACGTGKACMGGKCVPANTVICPELLMTNYPTSTPTRHPTTSAPTPTRHPTTSAPSRHPTTSAPSRHPTTSAPSRNPTTSTPSLSPTRPTSNAPNSKTPTSLSPTNTPSLSPTRNPTTSAPSLSPTRPTSNAPNSKTPTSLSPTNTPSLSPTRNPTTSAPNSKTPTSLSPTLQPTTTETPTTNIPTLQPTSKTPTSSPNVSGSPTKSATKFPTKVPTKFPTKFPTKVSNKVPTKRLRPQRRSSDNVDADPYEAT